MFEDAKRVIGRPNIKGQSIQFPKEKKDTNLTKNGGELGCTRKVGIKHLLKNKDGKL